MSYGFLVGDSSLLPARFSYGYFDLSGESDCPERVFEEFRIFVQKVRRQGLSPADFERAKRILYADFVASFDTTEDIASELGSYAQSGLCAYDFIEAVDGVTLDDAAALFDLAFRDSQYTLSVVLPAEAP
jgi:predicted Zn-dependent peptidase